MGVQEGMKGEGRAGNVVRRNNLLGSRPHTVCSVNDPDWRVDVLLPLRPCPRKGLVRIRVVLRGINVQQLFQLVQVGPNVDMRLCVGVFVGV